MDSSIKWLGREISAVMTKLHLVCSSRMSRVISSDWIPGWTSKNLDGFGTEVCEFKSEAMKLFSSVSESKVYTIRSSFLNHFVEDLRSLGDVSILAAYVDKHFNIIIKRVHRWSSKT